MLPGQNCAMRSSLSAVLTCLHHPPRRRQRGEVTVCLEGWEGSNDINVRASHDRANLPRYKFVLSVTMLLTASTVPRGDI